MVHFRIAYRPQPIVVTIENKSHDVYVPVFSWEEYRIRLADYAGRLTSGTVQYSDRHGSQTGFWPIIRASWSNSFRLFLIATSSGIVMGIVAGCLVAARGRFLRFLSFAIPVVGLSFPDFLMVMTGHVVSLFTYRVYDYKPWPILSSPETFNGWILPIAVLILAPLGFTARITASAMSDVMAQDYIRTARSKGLPEGRVIMGHAFKNVVPRIFSGLPTVLNATLSSLVIVERLTAWPGISSWLIGQMTRLPSTPPGEPMVWTGITPAVVATTSLLFISWFLFMDGFAHTVRLLAARSGQEVPD